MAARNVSSRPAGENGHETAGTGGEPRYRPLPTGSHGLDPETVRHDQRERLRQALAELIALKGYPAVRIVDLARLSRVSQPTFYSLFEDKEDLLVSAYDGIAALTARTVLSAYAGEAAHGERMRAALHAFTELAAAEPQAMSLLVLGAFGAGANALEHRNRSVAELERRIRAARSGDEEDAGGDLTVMAILGGIREVTALRLCQGRERELPALADELADWAESYPLRLPPGLAVAAAGAGPGARPAAPSERARRAEGPLPSGRSELPRPLIEKSQRERIVDATAAIAAEKGLAGLTIPEIARRANVSHQTFYAIYRSKHEAYLGAQKVGMHQALRVAVEAWEARMPDWPRAIACGLGALVDYLVSEPDHAHLSIVDTFGAGPETFEVRRDLLAAFASYFHAGYELAPAGEEVPAIAAEAVVGGCWQALHHYVDGDRIAELPAAAPQLAFLLLAPFLGADAAAAAARDALAGSRA